MIKREQKKDWLKPSLQVLAFEKVRGVGKAVTGPSVENKTAGGSLQVHDSGGVGVYHRAKATAGAISDILNGGGDSAVFNSSTYGPS